MVDCLYLMQQKECTTCVHQVSLAVRNPFEVVKQRAQAYTHMNSLQALRYTLVQEVCTVVD